MSKVVIALLVVLVVLFALFESRMFPNRGSETEPPVKSETRNEEIFELRLKTQHLDHINKELLSKLQKLEDENGQHRESLPNETKPPSKKEIQLSEWETTVRCFFFSDFTQMCVYDYLCSDGNNLYFLDPSQPSNQAKIKLIGEEQGTAYDSRYHEPYPWPVKNGTYVPAGSSFAGKVFSIPSSHLGNEKSVEILPGAIWYSHFDGNPLNLWHSAAQVMLMWEAQLYNETLPEGAKLPSVDYFQSPRDFIPMGWQEEMFRTITQPHTQFLFPQYFLTEEEFPVSQKRKETENFHNFTIPLRPPGKPSISENNLLCSEKAVVFSHKPRLFSGIYSAHRYKKAIGERLGFPPQKPKGRLGGSHSITNKVVLDYREPGRSRSLDNRNEILELLEYYNLTVVFTRAWPHMTNLSVQIEELWDADVHIIVHGAGEMNSIFLPYRATLIELLPYGYPPPMYDNIADAIGLHYIGVQSHIKGGLSPRPCGGELYKTAFYQLCATKSHLDFTGDHCGSFGKNACVHAPIYEVEQALISAYDFIGENLNLRVDKLFSKTREFRENDWHHRNNTFWIPEGLPPGKPVNDPITWEAHLQELKEQEQQ